MAYGWETAYQNHLQNAHGRSRMNVAEAKVKLCPQTVFACGFENCTQVFEAPSEDDTAATLKEYSGHIVKHFEEGSNGGRWTYSNRVRNLLRQLQVSAFWEKAWPEMERPKLQWEPPTSVFSTMFNFLDDDRMNGGIVQLKTLDGQIWLLHLDGTRVSPNLVRLVRQHLARPHILWVAGLSKHLFYDRQEEVVKIFNETNQHNESYELQFSPPVASVSPLGPNGFLAVADSHISICLQFGPFIKIDRACNDVDVRVQLFKNSCIIFYYHQENVGYQAVQLIELVEEDSNGPDSSVDDSEIAETLECLKAYTDMTSFVAPTAVLDGNASSLGMASNGG